MIMRCPQTCDCGARASDSDTCSLYLHLLLHGELYTKCPKYTSNTVRIVYKLPQTGYLTALLEPKIVNDAVGHFGTAQCRETYP
jgi:hypothetical protein